MAQALFLFGHVVLPVLILVGLGALVQRWRPIDLKSLSNLQISLFVPAFLFVRVADSTLSWTQMAGIAGAVVLAKLVLGLPLYALLRARKLPRPTMTAVLLGAVIFNAGNFGIPVAERAFGREGGAVQALVVMVANLSLWGVAYVLLAGIDGGFRRAIAGYFRLPMVYCLIAALGLKALHANLPEPVAYALHLVAEGLVPLALITLGAQLAKQTRRPRWRIVGPVIVLKLLALPAAAALVVWALGLWPWPGAALIVAAAGPTAVNTLLLTMEQDGDVELAADCVFWTTLFSGLTVTAILALVTSLGGGPPR
jgi:predicted permease